MTAKPVAIIMGSQSDWPTMRHAAETLDALGVGYDKRIVSAHRTPERLYAFAKGAKAAGVKVIIAGAGGAAHLPGMTAAMTTLPVFGVPVESKALSGVDSLYSIVQMPPGVPVGTLAIGKAGAINAALLAASVLALTDAALAKRLEAWRKQQTDAVAEAPEGRSVIAQRARPLGPDATIGILGGGQLGRMLALAAARLGFSCHVLCPDPHSPAFDVVRQRDRGRLRRHGGARPLRRRCRRRHLRVRERAGRDRDVSLGAQAGAARPEGAGDHAGPADREGVRAAASASARPTSRGRLSRRA